MTSMNVHCFPSRLLLLPPQTSWECAPLLTPLQSSPFQDFNDLSSLIGPELSHQPCPQAKVPVSSIRDIPMDITHLILPVCKIQVTFISSQLLLPLDIMESKICKFCHISNTGITFYLSISSITTRQPIHFQEFRRITSQGLLPLSSCYLKSALPQWSSDFLNSSWFSLHFFIEFPKHMLLHTLAHPETSGFWAYETCVHLLSGWPEANDLTSLSLISWSALWGPNPCFLDGCEGYRSKAPGPGHGRV